jgi:hypothetical protein
MKVVNSLLGALVICLLSCGGKTDKSAEVRNSDEVGEEVEVVGVAMKKKVQDIKQELCSSFPKDLVMSYNPDAKKLEVESIDDGNGGIMDCKLKLFYGEKDHEYWGGLVSAGVNHNAENPFWQYDPKRNPNLYQKVEGVGEQAVYVSNIRQLFVLKAGVIYYIAPPSYGNTTNSGKENKEIAVEIAKFYKL